MAVPETPKPTRRQHLCVWWVRYRRTLGALILIGLAIGGFNLYGHMEYDQGHTDGRRNVCIAVFAMNGVKYGDAVKTAERGDQQAMDVVFQRVPSQCVDVVFKDLITRQQNDSYDPPNP